MGFERLNPLKYPLRSDAYIPAITAAELPKGNLAGPLPPLRLFGGVVYRQSPLPRRQREELQQFRDRNCGNYALLAARKEIICAKYATIKATFLTHKRVDEVNADFQQLGAKHGF